MYDALYYLKREADLGEYWFCFLIMNFCFLIGYFSFRNDKDSLAKTLTKIFILFFCVYAFWDTDYFTFARSFHSIGRSSGVFKDFAYDYIRAISLGSYPLFRLYIWGGAFWLVLKTVRLYRLPHHLYLYIFLIFFLLTFSYARASLAMSVYFYGFSNLIYANRQKHKQIVIGLLFIGASFLFHRSMLVTIALTPLAFLQYDKKRLIILLGLTLFMSTIVMSYLTNYIEHMTMSGGAFESFEKSSTSYIVKIGEAKQSNWKFALIKNLRYSSFYILTAYIGHIMYSKKNVFTKQEYRLFSLVIVIMLFSTLFIGSKMLGHQIIGYRYLFMTGIPLCILMTAAVERKQCGRWMLHLLLMPAFLYAEGFIFGKILSLM